jgi:FHA domain-containing protein
VATPSVAAAPVVETAPASPPTSPQPAVRVEAPPQVRAAPPPPAEPPLLEEGPPAAPPVAVATLRRAPPPPRVSVLRTVWHPLPERRTARVSIEGRGAPLELREGDAVGELVVSRIEPAGVVFEQGGREWRERVAPRGR